MTPLEVHERLDEFERRLNKLERLHKVVDAMPITNFPFSTRSHNVLFGAGYHSIGQVCELTNKDILLLRHSGRKTLHDIKTVLDAFGVVHKLQEPLPLRMQRRSVLTR